MGFTCCILILLWIQDELSFDRFHTKSSEIYRLTTTNPEGTWPYSPWALMPVLKDEFPEITKGTWYAEVSLPVKVNEKAFYEDFALVSKDFFGIFTFQFLYGDPKTSLERPNSVIITDRIARKYFAGVNPLGKVIQFNYNVDLLVTGVIKDVPANSSIQFDLVTDAVHVFGEDRLRTWSTDCTTYLLLHENADASVVDKKIKNTIIENKPDNKDKKYVNLQPFKDVHLRALNGLSPIVFVRIFSVIAIIILLIASLNYANLSIAQCLKRSREVGLRKVSGANRKNLIFQFIGESLLMTFFALIIAIILVALTLPALNTITGKSIGLAIFYCSGILLVILFVALLTGILSGLYPAFFLSSIKPVSIPRNYFTKYPKGNIFRRSFIIIQFITSIVMIVSVLVTLKQMRFIRSKDLGFDRKNILIFRTSEEIRNNYHILKEELVRNNNVVNVTAASSLPLNINNNNPFYWEGRNSDNPVSMNFACIDYDYFETFDMKMKYGRSFSREFLTDVDNYIINEAALKLTGFDQPIGKLFSMWSNEGTLIGVIKDFHGTSLHSEIRPIAFCLYNNLPYSYMFIKINANSIPPVIEEIERTIEKFAPNYILNYSFLEDAFEFQYQSEERQKQIIEYFTLIAIIISCLGLFGLILFVTEQKNKEIAIRKVWGASTFLISWKLIGEFVLLFGMANLIAWPLVYYIMHNWLQNYAYHISIDIWVFLIAGMAALVIALATISYQTVKTSLKNPLDSLKQV